jgi:hypothetical protein
VRDALQAKLKKGESHGYYIGDYVRAGHDELAIFIAGRGSHTEKVAFWKIKKADEDQLSNVTAAVQTIQMAVAIHAPPLLKYELAVLLNIALAHTRELSMISNMLLRSCL